MKLLTVEFKFSFSDKMVFYVSDTRWSSPFQSSSNDAILCFCSKMKTPVSELIKDAGLSFSYRIKFSVSATSDVLCFSYKLMFSVSAAI